MKYSSAFSDYLSTIDNIAIWHTQGLITGKERIERKARAKRHYKVQIALEA